MSDNFIPTPPQAPPGYAPYPPQQVVYQQVLVAPQKSSGMAVASLVLGIVGLIFGFIYVIPPILATIFGGVAIFKIGKAQGQVGGKGSAIAGLTMGIIGTVLWGFLFLAIIGASS